MTALAGLARGCNLLPASLLDYSQTTYQNLAGLLHRGFWANPPHWDSKVLKAGSGSAVRLNVMQAMRAGVGSDGQYPL